MKIKYTRKEIVKQIREEKHCERCDKIMNYEDIKFGCARCEWRDAGHDVPKGWIKQ